MVISIKIKRRKIVYFFIFTLSILIHCVCSAAFVSNISDNNICLFYHPSVSMRNSVSWRNVFKLRIYHHIKSFFSIFNLIFLIFNGNIRNYKYKLRLRVKFFELLSATICKAIKTTVFTKKKIHSIVCNPFFQYFQNHFFIFQIFNILGMSTKCNYHIYSPYNISDVYII